VPLKGAALGSGRTRADGAVPPRLPAPEAELTPPSPAAACVRQESSRCSFPGG